MYREAGFLAVQAGVRLDKLDEAIDLCKKEMFSIGKNLKLAELEAAKEYLWGRTKLAMDRTSFWANFLGRKLLLDGKMANVDEERGKYMKVSLEETKKLAKELLTAERVRMLVVRNKKI